MTDADPEPHLCRACGCATPGFEERLAALRSSGRVSVVKALDFFITHRPEWDAHELASAALELARGDRGEGGVPCSATA